AQHTVRVGSIVTVRDEDVDQAIPPRLNTHIVRELHEYRRLIIRIRKTLTTMTHSQARNLRRHHVRPLNLTPLAYVEVLAVGAVMQDYAVSNVVMVWDTLEAVYRFESVGGSDRFDVNPGSLVRHHWLRDVLNNEGLCLFWVTEQVSS